MAKDKKVTTAVDEASAVVDSTSVKDEANQIAEAGKKVDEATTEEVEQVIEAVKETSEEETSEEETTEEEIIEEVIVDSLEAVKSATETEKEILTFEYHGNLYKFKDETPNRIQLDEGVLSQEEIMSNPELMQELIDSECIFITKL